MKTALLTTLLFVAALVFITLCGLYPQILAWAFVFLSSLCAVALLCLLWTTIHKLLKG